MNRQQAQQIEKEAQNMPLEIGFKRLSDNAISPTKAHATDSGFDLFAAQDVIIAPGETVVVTTDIAVQLPQGYEAQVRPRSGITSKTKLRVQLGTIDEQYRGNIGIIVDNVTLPDFDVTHSSIDGYYAIIEECHEINTLDGVVYVEKPVYNGTYLIRKGDKIAQLVVQPIPTTVAVEITGELEDSGRGVSGFGSSGV
ncbi:deoxyuridine 5'-triphosphate nucleotidohydrolase [Lysinibacillus fusiformis]|uniref:dUTP diphosphatase n=1 Tax=Lysinibacillus fusiformis TaxID=28031 RepID=UPI00301AF8F7